MKDLSELESYFVSKQKKHGHWIWVFEERKESRLISKGKRVALNFSSPEIEGLTKAFMYEHYVKARIISENISLTEVIENELSRYPYTRKKLFEVGVLFSKSFLDTS